MVTNCTRPNSWTTSRWRLSLNREYNGTLPLPSFSILILTKLKKQDLTIYGDPHPNHIQMEIERLTLNHEYNGHHLSSCIAMVTSCTRTTNRNQTHNNIYEGLVDWKHHYNIQTELQRWITNAMSCNCLPSDYSVEVTDSTNSCCVRPGWSPIWRPNLQLRIWEILFRDFQKLAICW